MAGEKSGSLVEALDHDISYQRLTLGGKEKAFRLAALSRCALIVLVIALMVFLVTYVVPNFALLYSSMGARLPLATSVLIAIGTTARSYVLLGFAALVGAGRRRLFLVAPRRIPGNHRPGHHESTGCRQYLDQIPSSNT